MICAKDVIGRQEAIHSEVFVSHVSVLGTRRRCRGSGYDEPPRFYFA